MMHDLKVLRYDSCNKGITQFYLPPTHKPYLPLVPSRRHHRPLAGTNLYCLVTEARRCEKHAQSFYTACPAETRTHDLLIASLTLPTAPQYHLVSRSSTVLDVLGFMGGPGRPRTHWKCTLKKDLQRLGLT